MKRESFVLYHTTVDGITFYGVFGRAADGSEQCFPVISPLRSDVEVLIRRVNGSDLDPVHYRDVVEDYLFELYCGVLRANGLR